MTETCHNYPQQEPQDSQKDYRRETEEFVYLLMDKFSGVQTKEQLYNATKSLLEELGRFFKADRVFFYQLHNRNQVQHVKYGWRDWSKTNHNLREEDCARLILQNYSEQLQMDENVVICDIETIRDGYPSLYRPLCVNGVKNWVSIPLFSRGMLDGVLSMVNPEMKHLETIMFLMRSMVRLFSLHSQAVSDIEAMELMASTDRLTGVDSRMSGGMKVNESLQRGEHGAFLLVDCDNFKHINEKFGHEVGDRLLKATSNVLRHDFPQATIMRLSGDEFGLFFPMLKGDRNLLGQWIYRFFYNINRMKVDGMGKYRVSYSLGGFAYEANLYHSFDQVYQKARALCRQSKEYEGNYMMSEQGGIPDLETAFYLLREDRHLYDSLNDDLFNIRDEESWVRYLHNSALLKSNMCWRNQRQYEQILNYFAGNDVVEEDYEHLYDLVVRFRNTLDAFMAEKLVGEILLPYYSKLFESGEYTMPEQTLRGHLAKLYLHMGDSMIGIYLMGDTSHGGNIREMFDHCIEVSRTLQPDDPAFEYQIYALCQLVGHYEFFDRQLASPRECDAYYEQLSQYLVGPKAVVLRDPILLPYYNYLIKNARAYPVLRASYLAMNGSTRTPAETHELMRKMNYIRNHSKDGILDTCSTEDMRSTWNRLFHQQLFRTLPPDQLFDQYYKELAKMRDSKKSVFSTDDLMSFLILLLASASALKECDLPDERKRGYAIEGWELFLQLYKRRKNEATDRQSWFMACYLLSLFIRNRMLTAEDKRNYLIRTISVLMLDTYSHSKAMANYAKVITSNIIDHRPELLIHTLKNTGTVKQVKAHRKQILDFIETACLVHDTGKLAQIPIISNSYRKLSDHEFQILRMHPTEGRKMLSEEPYFAQFDDVIEGHHCSYDGKSGYPRGYEFRYPHQRIFVDILSICDSLEAATSRIGRNYRMAKPFSQIMDEFYGQSGTRYNPQVLESIISSRETYNYLKWLVDENWRSNYQNIFQELFNGKSLPMPVQRKESGQMESSVRPATTKGKSMLQTLSVEQLERIANQQADHNRWLTQKLLENVESNHELNQMTKGLNAIFDVMALVKVKDGSIKIIQGHPNFLRDFPPTEYHPVEAISEYSVKYVVKPQWREKLLEFHDYTTLTDRLRGRKSINIELETNFEGWCRFSYCPAEYDDMGNLEKVLFTSECINEEVLALQRLKFIAEYDGLTGLRSRYGGEQLISDRLAKQTPGFFSVMDIDKFKSFNDTYGHAVGDKVLEAIGKLLQQEVSDDYTIIRQGGDEFVSFVKSDMSIEAFRERKQNFYDQLLQVRIPELHGRMITVSLGVVRYDGSQPTTFDELFRRADHLLYQSKRFAGNYMSIENF